MLVVMSGSAGADLLLIIQSYHREYEWDAHYSQGIQKTLPNYDFAAFELDTKRLPREQHAAQADRAWAYYEALTPKPRLVFLGDDAALRLLGSRFAASGTPTVYLGINNNPRVYLGDQWRRLTGVLERPLLLRSITTIDEVLPQKADKILVLFDTDTTSQIVFESEFKNRPSIAVRGITVDFQLIGDWTVWQQHVRDAQQNGYDAIIVGLYQTLRDVSGAHVPDSQVVSWTAANTPIPPFAFWSFAVGRDKAVGGFVLDGQEQGKLAADMARQLLETTTTVEQIRPKTAERGQYLFSRAALARFSLQLPPAIAAQTTWVD